jgi:ubiquinone/menaquinone biosynthesis C-methylase UbiE
MSTELVTRHLVCPKCYGALRLQREEIACAAPACGWRGEWKGDVAIVVRGAGRSFFDDKVAVMQAGHSEERQSSVFQTAQMRIFADAIRPGSIVLDVGCGPKAPYERRVDCTVIGVDMSLDSLRANADVDLRVYGSAAELPIRARSVDTVVCVYSVHHFVATTVAESESLVQAAFREFARVLKPDGELFVFDVSPWHPFAVMQGKAWNLAKRMLRGKLDMFFWRDQALTEMVGTCLPSGTALEIQSFDTPWWSTFAPVFALPKLRVPRLLYPFDINMYRWKL